MSVDQPEIIGMNSQVTKPLKNMLRGRFGSHVLANYYRLVFYTSRIVYDVPGGKALATSDQPLIFTSWHGHSYMMPFMFEKGCAPTLMAARHGDGRLAGNVMHMLGAPLIFGSGSTGKTKSSKGGAVAFLRLLKLLRAGHSIKITADVPKIAREAGEGIITLARKSGAPIVPVGVASSRRRFAKSWDRMQFNLPFSRIAFVQGDSILVPDDETPLAVYQTQLNDALNAVNQRALALADGLATT